MNEYKEFATRIIELAAEDLRTEYPNTEEYQSADMFFKSKWFRQLAGFCISDVDAYLNEIKHMKIDRATRWYESLVGIIRDNEDKRIYRVSRTWQGSFGDKMIWAWETSKRHPKPRRKAIMVLD